MKKYTLTMAGTVSVESVTVKSEFSVKTPDDAAIRWATGKMKQYYPVFYRGTLYREVDGGFASEPVADFNTHVEVRVRRV